MCIKASCHDSNAVDSVHWVTFITEDSAPHALEHISNQSCQLLATIHAELSQSSTALTGMLGGAVCPTAS